MASFKLKLMNHARHSADIIALHKRQCCGATRTWSCERLPWNTRHLRAPQSFLL